MKFFFLVLFRLTDLTMAMQWAKLRAFLPIAIGIISRWMKPVIAQFGG